MTIEFRGDRDEYYLQYGRDPLIEELLDNPIYWVDFYKIGHVSQYQKGTNFVWVNWTGRSTRVPGAKFIKWFGLQYFMIETLIEAFNKHFFNRSWEVLEIGYKMVIKATLGVDNPKTDHIKALHSLGYLPIKIYALPEGVEVPLGVPTFVIVNTHPDFFWLPNYLETILSNKLWKASTSATTASNYRKMFIEYAKVAGETDFGFVDWMGHDFSFRGMSGLEDAILSGMGHLLSFSGTDTVPAILAAARYYSAPLNVGGSIPATEHSVMCAGTQEGEFETFHRLITETYPSGPVSIVSDTWDLWKVLIDYMPRLKHEILARDGKVVIRPDSGDPVKIVIGDPDSYNDSVSKGVVTLLDEVMGSMTNASGYKTINKAACIYGDSITLERADQILFGLIQKGFSPYNMVFGIGSFTYEYTTRDVYGFAMKATAVERDGHVLDIFKKPVTDDGQKNSHKGIPAVYIDTDGKYFVKQGSAPVALDNCAYMKVFENSKLLHFHTFDEIRKRVRA